MELSLTIPLGYISPALAGQSTTQPALRSNSATMALTTTLGPRWSVSMMRCAISRYRDRAWPSGPEAPFPDPPSAAGAAGDPWRYAGVAARHWCADRPPARFHPAHDDWTRA